MQSLRVAMQLLVLKWPPNGTGMLLRKSLLLFADILLLTCKKLHIPLPFSVVHPRAITTNCPAKQPAKWPSRNPVRTDSHKPSPRSTFTPNHCACDVRCLSRVGHLVTTIAKRNNREITQTEICNMPEPSLDQIVYHSRCVGACAIASFRWN